MVAAISIDSLDGQHRPSQKLTSRKCLWLSRWGGGPAHGGSEIFFNATEVSEGVIPKGYAWRRTPIPISGGHAGIPGPVNVPSFPPPCTNHSWCIDDQDGRTAVHDLYRAPEIVDFVKIPPDLPAGDYLLGWRWDCEQVLNHY